MDFEADTNVAPTGSLLVALTDWVRRIREQTAIVAQKEAELAEAQDTLNKLTLVHVPEAMKEAGLTELTLTDGAKLVIKKDLKVSITNANKPQAFGWLRTIGHGMAVSQTLAIDMRSLPLEDRDALVNAAATRHADATVQESIHPQTLKALVRELLEDGVKVPECVSVFEFERAEIKTKKTA